MDAFVHVDIFQEMLNLVIGFLMISIFGQVDFFLLDRTDQSFSMAVLSGSADIGHTDLNVSNLQFLDVVLSSILDTLVGMVDLGIATSRFQSLDQGFRTGYRW
jgi:ABC-type proline/glycine betaine transport system permease subunit